MLEEFKQAISNISDYNDMLEILILYYFDSNMLKWYKNLIDNKNLQKTQTQIGIFYNMKQDAVCRTLKHVQKRIKQYINDLDIYRKEILTMLDYININATKAQKNLLLAFIQRKSYSAIGREYNISRQAAHSSILRFFKHVKQKNDIETLKFKTNLYNLYKIDLTKM